MDDEITNEELARLVTKKQFDKYVEVQHSGKTSMFLIGNVMKASGLTQHAVVSIQKYYNQLYEMYDAHPPMPIQQDEKKQDEAVVSGPSSPACKVCNDTGISSLGVACPNRSDSGKHPTKVI